MRSPSTTGTDYEAHGRAVRSEGFLFVRNSRPAMAWQGPADSVASPSFQALRAWRDAGKLTPAQADVFLRPRPVEELYRTADDPDQLRNLAGTPEFAAVRQRLAKLLDQWIDETGDAAPDGLSPDAFDRETGKRLARGEVVRGIAPGTPRDAIHVNRSGPR